MVIVTASVYLVAFILSDLLRPKPDVENAKKAGLGDFQFPTATEGLKVPIVWGTVQLKGPNVIWYGDVKQKPIKEEVGAGIFSGGEDVILGFKYFVGIQFGLCRGEVDELLRIWVDEKEIFSGNLLAAQTTLLAPHKLFGGQKHGTGSLKGNLTLFAGSETQIASTYLSTFQQEGGDTPAYRGTCYAVFEQGYIGNSTQIAPWWFELKRIPIGLGSANSVVNTFDANPAHVIYEIITDDEWGMNQPAADVDTVNFAAAAATLASEGNGFSLALSQPRNLSDLLDELERQIQGKVYLDQASGKWKINLARNDYTVGSLDIMDESNVLEVRSFSRGAWQDTTNHFTINYRDRNKDYFETFALAQDMANQRIQGAAVLGNQNYSGVKDKTLANNIAWRELRARSVPLARAVVVANRQFWDLTPFSVVRWTNAKLGLTELVMRIMKVDFGSLDSDEIVVTMVEDVFQFLTPSFGDPFGTGWVPPADVLVAVPTAEQTVIEAPRAFLTRDPNYNGGELLDKIWCGFRAQTNETTADIRERHASGTPAGDFADAGTIVGSYLLGQLTSVLDPQGGASSFTVTPNPDAQQEILDELRSEASLSDLGVNLVNLILIEDEFILVGDTNASGGNVDFLGCIRGVLDSSQVSHAANTKVHMIAVAGSLTSTTFPAGDNAHIRLLTESQFDELIEASATQITVALDDRLRRPYPPCRLNLNSSVWPTGSVSLDTLFGGGSTDDDDGINLLYVRRDFRNADEVVAQVDEVGLPSDFPSANTTEYEIEVRDDPDGSNTLLFTVAFGVGGGPDENDYDLSRTEMLANTSGVVPTRMRILVKTRHTVDSVVYLATQEMFHDFNVTSILSSLDALGALDTNDVSAITVATDSGTYTFTIATDLLTTGDLEARLNGGAWTTVISSGGGLSGTLAGVTAGDDIEVRHTQTGPGTAHTQLLVDDNGSTTIAQGVLLI